MTRRTLNGQLLRMLLAATVVPLLFTTGLMLHLVLKHQRNQLQSNAEALVEMIALRSSAAVAFQDHAAALENISPLRAMEHIAYACLSDKTLQFRVSIANIQGADQVCASRSRLTAASEADYSHPIMLGHDVIGHAMLGINQRGLPGEAAREASVIALFLGLAFALAFAWSRRVGRHLSEGIVAVAQGAAKLGSNRDALVSPMNRQVLEIELLTSSFNQMVQAISAAEAELIAARDWYQTLFDANPTNILVLDVCGCIVDANLTAQDYLHSSAQALRGQYLDTLFRAAEDGSIDDLLRRLSLGVPLWCTLYSQLPGEAPRWLRGVFRLSHLPTSEPRVFLVGQDVTEERRLADDLYRLAHVDQLTQIANRNAFEKRIESLIPGTMSAGEKLYIAFIDVDNFKVVNDTCGHMAGDAWLQKVGQLLSRHCNENVSAARLGGDEFGMLVMASSREAAGLVFESVRAGIAELRMMWDTQLVRLSASIGIAEINTPTRDRSELWRRADTACYMAKKLGRNRCCFYEASGTDLREHEAVMQLVSVIHRALEDRSVLLYYQELVPALPGPRLAPAGPDKLHIEILCRLNAADGTLLRTDHVIAAAERYNLAPQLDLTILNKVLAWLGAQHGVRQRLGRCAINLSGQSLSAPNFIDQVNACFERHAVSPTFITFEITETAAVERHDLALAFIHRMRAIGCTFALDDFGSGISSFSYLKNLPTEIVKIDGSIVANCDRSPDSLAIVKSINDLAHALGRETVAEFVSTPELARALSNIGVDWLQGFHFSRPRPLEDLLTHESLFA